MARMLPPEVSDETISGAERRLFRKIQRDLPDEWTVLHSLGLAFHDRKPWAEVDFVFVGPKGLFCLEVKGGRVARQEGRWLFTDRHGQVVQKAEGPFEQVAGATAALTHHIAPRFPQIWSAVVGYGVATPDVVFEIEGPDIERRVVYDVRDEARDFGSYLAEVEAYWRDRLEAQRRRPLHGLDGSECRRLVALLRGDFDLRPSLRTRVGVVNAELLRLTEEQYRILDALAENERVIIRGGAGTGKTLLAVEEARRQAEAGRRVFYCCFNKKLAAFAAGAMMDRDLITVRHLHGFMAETVARAGLLDRLPPADEADLFAVFYPELCTEALLTGDDTQQCDVLILDEAQDLLLESYVDVFDLVVKGGLNGGTWRAFLDPKQNIFLAVHPEGMRRLLVAHPAQYRLTVNCRNTAPIAVSTALLSGIAADETLVVGGPEVEIRWHRNAATQVRQVSRHLNRLLSGGLRPSDVILLSTRRLSRSSLASGLDSVPYDVREMSEEPLGPEKALRYSTIAGFKGLEADAVLIVDVNDLTSEESHSALYVGASRARALLALFISEEVRTEYEMLAEDFGRRLAEH